MASHAKKPAIARDKNVHVSRRERPVLLYDGDCAFCTRCARVLERIGSDAEILAWQLTDLAELGITEEQATDAVQWVRIDGTVRSGHEAIAAVLSTAGRIWKIIGRLVLLPGISWMAAKAYRLVARNRYRLPGSTPACAVTDEDHNRPAAKGRA
jgi:predicted DCC family thiol-disulfide oxidoreductase YuxK